MLAGPNGDNPLILGPAGTMHVGPRFCKMGGLAGRRGQASPGPGFAGYYEKTSRPGDRYAA
jgi:hypothetical protein